MNQQWLLRSTPNGQAIDRRRLAWMVAGAIPIGLVGAAVTYWASGGAPAWSFVASVIPYLIVLVCSAEWQLQAAQGHRWPRFRLGAGLIVFTLIAVWFAAFGGQRQAFLAASRQREQLRTELQSIVGQGTAGVGSHSVFLQVKRRDFSDDDLGRVVTALKSAGLRVSVLDVADTQVSDAGLKHFDDGPIIERLCVDRSRISPLGLRGLPWLGDLKSLSFAGIGVTADDVREIQRLAPHTNLGAP